ncbi:MAG: hypothetical protein M1358_02220 [Chloroflexi bacterium]|nr:hypothetical protein [Chloroflexota bacterium]
MALGMLRRYRQWLRVLGAVIFFTAVTVLITWPLAPHLGNSLYGGGSDGMYYIWLVGWYQKALFQLHRLPLEVPFLNYPEGWNLAFTETTPAMVLPALPLSLLAGPTFGYNFSVLLTFVLSGLGVHLWVWRLTKNTPASLIAGTIFAFAPFKMAYVFAGLFPLMGTQWFPFYFMCLYDLLQQRKWSWKTALLTALFLGLIGLTSQYYLYMTLITSCLFVGGYLLLVERKVIGQLRFWGRLGGVVLAAAPLVLVALAPYLLLASQSMISSRSLTDEVRALSASPTDFILPSTRHFLWGEWLWQILQKRHLADSTLYLGAVTLALLVVAFVKRKQIKQNGLPRVLAWTGALAFMLALGVDFHWLGQSVTVDVPQFLQQWHPFPKTFVPPPGYFLFKYLPFYGLMRNWMRYGVFVDLFVSVLAGLGAAWLLGRMRPRLALPVTALLLALILFDFYPYVNLRTVQGRPVDYWLASQPGNGAVVQFPFPARQVDGSLIYYTSVNNKPFIGGFVAAFGTPQFRRIQPILESFPDEKSVAVLKELGTQWVLVDSNEYRKTLSQTLATIESLGLKPEGKMGDQYVYELPAK